MQKKNNSTLLILILIRLRKICLPFCSFTCCSGLLFLGLNSFCFPAQNREKRVNAFLTDSLTLLVSGKVTDQVTGVPLMHAGIVLKNPNTGKICSFFSGPKGEFHIHLPRTPPEETWTLEVSMPNYKNLTLLEYKPGTEKLVLQLVSAVPTVYSEKGKGEPVRGLFHRRWKRTSN